MKSIKPGRGPSMLSGVMGIFMVGFGIIWTVIAAQASVAFSLFGVLWTCMAAIITIYNFKNATRKNRYSAYDITDENEEVDPLNQLFVKSSSSNKEKEILNNNFCPYCGKAINEDFEFCNGCGKKLP